MFVIRLQKVGRRNKRSFRVILTPKRSSPKGKVIEFLGNFDPKTNALYLKKERISYWLSKGAKASSTLHNLLIKEKIIEGKKAPKHKIIKKEEAAKPVEAKPATASAEVSAKASSDEAKAA